MKKPILHIITYAFLGLVFCLLIPPGVWAQLVDDNGSDGEGAPRIYKYSARTGALGDATVADAGNLSVININPAGLSFVPNLQVGQINLSQNWNNNLMMENFTLPAFRIKEHSFAFQFGIQHDRGLESLNLLGENSMPTPKIMLYQLDLAYSFSIDEAFSFGIFNNISYANNPTSQSWTYYPVLGILYTPTESLSYGLTFKGLGNSAAYEINDPPRTTLGTQNLREILELGATLKLPVHAENYFSLSLASEKRFGEDNIRYKAGLELTGIPHLALRTGLIFIPETNLYAPRFGVGLLTNFLKLDYTISHHRRLLARYHQLGVTLNFAFNENL